MRVAAGLVLILLGAFPVFAQVNLTGSWQPKYWTVKMVLQQEAELNINRRPGE
jgi:hypothetical protein